MEFDIEKVKVAAEKLGLELTTTDEVPGFYDSEGELIITFDDVLTSFNFKK